MEEVGENEKVLNFLNQKITEYLVQINGLELQDPDREVIGALFHVVSDFERIGDHSTNIGEMAQIIIDNKASLSEAAAKELKHMQDLVLTVLDDSIRLFEDGGRNKELADQVNRIEQTIDDETEPAQGKPHPASHQWHLYAAVRRHLQRYADESGTHCRPFDQYRIFHRTY